MLITCIAFCLHHTHHSVDSAILTPVYHWHLQLVVTRNLLSPTDRCHLHFAGACIYLPLASYCHMLVAVTCALLSLAFLWICHMHIIPVTCTLLSLALYWHLSLFDTCILLSYASYYCHLHVVFTCILMTLTSICIWHLHITVTHTLQSPGIVVTCLHFYSISFIKSMYSREKIALISSMV